MSKSANAASLEQLSKEESDFSLSKATTFYTKGPLIGFILDLEIRKQTKNKYSLDNAMFDLYAKAKKGKYFKDEELIGLIEKSTKTNLKDIYTKYIAGVDSLRLGEYAKYAGLELFKKQQKPSGVDLGGVFQLLPDSSAYFVAAFTNDDLSNAGVMLGDTIITWDDAKLTPSRREKLSKQKDAPIQVSLVVGRPGIRKNIKAILTRPLTTKTVTTPVADMDEVTPEQLATRQGIYGKKEGW